MAVGATRAQVHGLFLRQTMTILIAGFDSGDRSYGDGRAHGENAALWRSGDRSVGIAVGHLRSFLEWCACNVYTGPAGGITGPG